MFVTYGLAYSLIASAATAVRRRDAMIVILASTVFWGIFVESERGSMARFLIFATLITIGILSALWMTRRNRASLRIVAGAALPALLCGFGGFIIYGFAIGANIPDSLYGSLSSGFTWGFSLGIAVGLGVTLGVEVLRWRMRLEES